MWNRPPLLPNVFDRLRPGSIEPRGWLREQLRLSAVGLTGRMMDIWSDVGPQSGWLGGGEKREVSRRSEECAALLGIDHLGDGYLLGSKPPKSL